MEHAQARQILARALDGALAPAEDEQLSAHLAGCAECRAYQAGLQRLDERLRAGLLLPPDPRSPAQRAVYAQASLRRMHMTHQVMTWSRRLAVVVILGLVLVVAVARLLPRSPAPIVPAAAQSATPGPRLTATPSPASFLHTPTAEVTATALPPVPMTAYTSPDKGVSLQYPSTWRADGADRFVGSDGFVEMSMGPSMTPKTLAQACEQEAADAARYGAGPQILPGQYLDGLATCLILSSPDPGQGKTSALIIAIPGSGVPVIFFTLRTDPPHFEMIGATLRLPNLQTIPQTPTPGPTEAIATPDPNQTPAPIQATVTTQGALTVEEYPVVSAALDTPSHLEFSQRIPPEVLAKRAAWRGYDVNRLDETNAALAPFGYTLRAAGDQLYDLLGPAPSGGQTLIKQVSTFWPPSLSDKDFAMITDDAGGSGKTYLVRAGSLTEWDPFAHHYARPVLVGGQLIAVAASATPGRVDVTADGHIVYTHYSDLFSVDEPVKGLWAWNGHWVLEVAGEIIVDGQSLNTQQGYAEAFGWQLIAGQPFYFFRRGDTLQVSYAGQDLPLQYAQVIHYRCCESSAFNAAANSHMAWFYALKDGIWNYVEIGIYP